jgi:hypothetical protein
MGYFSICNVNCIHDTDIVGLLPSKRLQYFDPICLAACGKSDPPMYWDGFHRLHQPDQEIIESAFYMNMPFYVHDVHQHSDTLLRTAEYNRSLAEFKRFTSLPLVTLKCV